jgi:hypothetical protein
LTEEESRSGSGSMPALVDVAIPAAEGDGDAKLFVVIVDVLGALGRWSCPRDVPVGRGGNEEAEVEEGDDLSHHGEATTMPELKERGKRGKGKGKRWEGRGGRDGVCREEPGQEQCQNVEAVLRGKLLGIEGRGDAQQPGDTVAGDFKLAWRADHAGLSRMSAVHPVIGRILSRVRVQRVSFFRWEGIQMLA